ncbi:N-methylhydantoinase A [Pseudonocardia autotrophica]|uniref:Acetophenone carboxylase gamma subunit n=2 Tax=Pseudonocardia TaxID=1847 RepID=A0A1Y2N9T4_PSEAH|nr:Acetophenone carboxylase gamma subunit [Pseudonocardia autotrophica]TDN74040.1 N-methylhydantoinase A [Pseudonocardia autotrophica]BBG04797.1 5-oxoprolinase [Pseudonocardia autotrophica]GEC23453.1 5-oxoprolinase [Pseudonocardia saturnea]
MDADDSGGIRKSDEGTDAMVRIGIDTGGTFTDLVVADGDEIRMATKSLTTHGELAAGLLSALGKAELEPGEVESVVHGTTVALNAILTRRGALVGLLTTRGFRDLLDMGRGWRSADALTDPRWRRPHELRPIVERHLRRPVAERVRADGSVLVPLDEAGLLAEVDELYEQGCRSIAICFLHAYKFPAHEERAAELIRERYPDVGVSLSSAVAPFPREYNRLSTCVLNAYAQPLMQSYTRSVEERLAGAGHAAPLNFMTNDGGVSTPAAVSARPVTTLNSGPVGGVMGVQSYSRSLGQPNLVGFDMGGTSTDVAVIAEGRASTKRELELEHDLIVSMPVLEIHSIGAGGGSIAALDAAGGVAVGPQSAGSVPGPACYGRGGEVPTVTDALLLLGWLDPKTPLGGEIRPDIAAAERAFGPLAEGLATTPEQVAGTVAQVAIHNMAEAIRQLTVYRGVDPREFGLLAYGAAGPLAATQVARILEMPRVVFPALAGVFSAFGLLEGAGFDEEVVPVMAIASEEVAVGAFATMRETAVKVRERFGHPDAHAEFVVDGMYAGQRWELPALVDPTHSDPAAHLAERFGEAHRRQYGYQLPAPVQIANLRVRLVVPESRAPRPPALTRTDPARPHAGRDIVVGGERVTASVFRTEELAAGQIVHGPAVIEAPSYTGVLVPGDVARINEVGDIVVELEENVR